MVIREAGIDDLESITEIENRLFRHPWSRAQIRYELTGQPVVKTYVIESNEQIFGYLMAHITGNKVQIVNFAIDLPWQQQGYGKTLLEFFISQISRGTTIFLEVRRSNLKAIKLYIDVGFEKISNRDHYYEDGEDAIVMRLGK